MKAIFASKLFRASNRKDKIRAALSDPINAELVKQLRSYLDKDELEALSRTEEDVSNVSDEPSDVDNMDSNQSEMSEKGEGSSGSSPSKPSHHLSKMVKDDDLGTMGDDENVDLGSDFGEEPSNDEPDEVSEATDINDVATNVSSDDIQAALNADDRTCGVRRVSDKGSEKWIYYNDDINLNDVMECVISACEAYDLDFNRFARTENAIVFTCKENQR